MKQHQHTRNNIILLICLVTTILFLPAMSSNNLLIKNILFTGIICFGTFSLNFAKKSQKILIVSGILTICLNWINHFIANNVLSLVFSSSFFKGKFSSSVLSLIFVVTSTYSGFTSSVSKVRLVAYLTTIIVAICGVIEKTKLARNKYDLL